MKQYNKFDLHIYSKYSSFAISEPRDIINNCVKNNIKGFAVTDLNSISSWPFLHKLAKENNIVFIPGQEINLTYKNKFIGKSTAIFTLDKIDYTDIFEVLDEVKSQGALLSISHPFDIYNGFKNFDIFNHKPLNRKLRCIETFNSRVLSSYSNDKAQKFAIEHNLIQTAGSQAHLPSEIGDGYVLSSAENQSEILKDLKKRDVIVGGKITGVMPRLKGLGYNLFK